MPRTYIGQFLKRKATNASRRLCICLDRVDEDYPVIADEPLHERDSPGTTVIDLNLRRLYFSLTLLRDLPAYTIVSQDGIPQSYDKNLVFVPQLHVSSYASTRRQFRPARRV